MNLGNLISTSRLGIEAGLRRVEAAVIGSPALSALNESSEKHAKF